MSRGSMSAEIDMADAWRAGRLAAFRGTSVAPWCGMSHRRSGHSGLRVGPPTDGVAVPSRASAAHRRETYLPFGKPDFGDEEVEAVARVIRSGWVGMGAETIAFEQELAEAFGAPHVVTVNSCTSALFLSLLALGVGPGDEVVVPSFTWISTANAARHLGATPVFCDIDPGTMSVTAATVRSCLTPRTRAVIVVHMGGLAVDVDEIRRVVPSHIAIVEDAAHACGAQFTDGRPVGSSGNLTCFSFYANKNLSTGDGGAIALRNEAVANRLRSLRQHAMPNDAWKRFTDPRSLTPMSIGELGYKMNYTDLQAALGRVQLRRQPELSARRLAVAQTYAGTVAKLAWPVAMQTGVTGAAHARHLFLVQLPIEQLGVSRGTILAALRDRNIGASVHYPPIHSMPLYAGSSSPVLPVTDRVSERVLTLPISASMSTDDARQVVAALDEVLTIGFNAGISAGVRT
jgi:perosamine synthetase